MDFPHGTFPFMGTSPRMARTEVSTQGTGRADIDRGGALDTEPKL